MEYPLSPPVVSVRDVLPSLGFVPVWGTPTDEGPAYVFKGGGIDIIVAFGYSQYLRPQFMILGMARSVRHIRDIQQFIPPRLASRDQIVAWLAFAVGTDFSPSRPVAWFQEGLGLQGLLPWEEARRLRAAEMKELGRLRALRPHCIVERRDLRALLNSVLRTVGSPPVAGQFEVAFADGVLRLYARGRLHCAPAEGSNWSNRFSGDQTALQALQRRLMQDPVEVGIWQDHLEIQWVRIPVSPIDAG